MCLPATLFVLTVLLMPSVDGHPEHRPLSEITSLAVALQEIRALREEIARLRSLTPPTAQPPPQPPPRPPQPPSRPHPANDTAAKAFYKTYRMTEEEWISAVGPNEPEVSLKRVDAVSPPRPRPGWRRLSPLSGGGGHGSTPVATPAPVYSCEALYGKDKVGCNKNQRCTWSTSFLTCSDLDCTALGTEQNCGMHPRTCAWSNARKRCESLDPPLCDENAVFENQCVGDQREFENSCVWDCQCRKKVHDTHGAHESSMCKCDQVPDNPYHIHSKDACKMKKVSYSDGSVDETCYIVQTCGHGGHEHVLPYNILFITGSFGVGAFFRHWGARIPLVNKLPYTVLIFSIGTLFGFATNLGYPLSNYDGLAHMDPHEIFFIFLPILIFESAFATNYHIFKKVILGCLLMAGPGLMVSAALTGTMAKFVFTEYEWSWVTSLLFGTVLSATDPVAVVALLKELGASASISTMIEGESLFNDGTAIVFFNILKDAVPNGKIEKEWHEIVIEFCRVSLGGPLVGLILGFSVKYSLKAVFNDPLIEVTVTVFAAYVTFFVCEGFLAVSGVLGLVMLGCFLSYHRQCISPEVEHTLHHFWEITVYMTNTLIFGLAGLIVSQKAFEGLSGIDYAYLLVTYIGINIIRGIAILISMPILSRLPYKLDRPNAILVTWGGLRGAVGLALGLIVAGDNAILCSHPRLGSRFLFHCAGIVILTLLVNGVTTQPIVHYLGLDKIPDTKKRNMARAHHHLVEHMKQDLRGLMRMPVLADANWQQVRRRTLEMLKNPYDSHGDPDINPDIRDTARDAYLKLIEQAVWHLYEEGNVGARAARRLIAFCANANDEKRLLYSTDVEPIFDLPLSWRMWIFCCKPFPMARTRVEQKARESIWAHAFDVGIGFVNAHDMCINQLYKLLDRKTAGKLVRHCKREKLEALELLNDYTHEMPEIAVSIKTRHAARHVLNFGRSHCRHMAHEGMIDEGDTTALVGEVETLMKDLRNIPKAVEPSDIKSILIDHHGSWFNQPGMMKALGPGGGAIYTVEKFRKGVPIIEKGFEAEGFYAVTLGVVRVHIAGKAQYFGPGFCAGLHSTLAVGGEMGRKPRFTEIFAETAVVAAFFSASMINDIRFHCQATNRALWTQAGRQLAEHILGSTLPYAQWDQQRLHELCITGELNADIVIDGKTANELPSQKIHFLINGQCFEKPKSDEHNIEIIKEPSKLDDATTKHCIFRGEAVLLGIKDDLGASERARKMWGKIASKIRTIKTIVGRGGIEAIHKALIHVFGEGAKKHPGIWEERTSAERDWEKEFNLNLIRSKHSPTGPQSPLSRRGVARSPMTQGSPGSPWSHVPSQAQRTASQMSVQSPPPSESRRLRKERRKDKKEKRASLQSTTQDMEMVPQGSPQSTQPYMAMQSGPGSPTSNITAKRGALVHKPAGYMAVGSPVNPHHPQQEGFSPFST